MRSPHVTVLAVATLAIGSSMGPAMAGAAGPPPSLGLDEPCRIGLSGASAIVLDCQPGFATPHDRIVVYPRGGVDARADLRGQLDEDNAVWLFEPGATDTVALLIDFHRDAGGRPVADLHDDGGGDRTVAHVFVDGIPKSVEHAGRPSVIVTSRDAAWLVAGRPSFNLDILVDGPIRASFGSAEFLEGLQTDGHPDFEVHVRDTDDDGRPDLEWRQFEPPLPADPRTSGYIRTEITRNAEGDEVPITGSLFWLYLARAPVEHVVGHYVKDYGASPAPIEVDWENARVVQVSEFVASRGNPGNYFIYSIDRVVEGTTTAADFENPFAFYDLAGARDGWPDLSILFKATLPDEVLTPRRNTDPINVIEYSWGWRHDHNWTYALSLVGHQIVDKTIKFPEFAVRAVPPTDLPRWVADEPWDAATFVEVTPPFTTTEGISDYTVERGDNVLALRYLTGLDASPPIGVFSQVPDGYRGEYAFDLRGRPARLYLSPVDLRLHLRFAEGGVWYVGDGREMRYDSLGGEVIDHWTLLKDGAIVAELHVQGDQAIYTSAKGVRVGTLRHSADPTSFAPPVDHATWSRLGGLLDSHEPPFAPDDLGAMFDRIATSVQHLPGAGAGQLRQTDTGFRFVLTLRRAPANVPWAARHDPGEYLASYRPGQGYDLQPLGPPAIAVGGVDVAGGVARATETLELSAAVENRGHADGHAVRVTFLAGRDPAAMEPIGAAVVDVPGDSTARARLAWAPPDDGDWLLQAVADGPGGAGPAVMTRVGAGPALDPGAVLAEQQVPAGWLIGAAVLLLAGTLLAAATGSRLLRW